MCIINSCRGNIACQSWEILSQSLDIVCQSMASRIKWKNLLEFYWFRTGLHQLVTADLIFNLLCKLSIILVLTVRLVSLENTVNPQK